MVRHVIITRTEIFIPNQTSFWSFRFPVGYYDEPISIIFRLALLSGRFGLAGYPTIAFKKIITKVNRIISKFTKIYQNFSKIDNQTEPNIWWIIILKNHVLNLNLLNLVKTQFWCHRELKITLETIKTTKKLCLFIT